MGAIVQPRPPAAAGRESVPADGPAVGFATPTDGTPAAADPACCVTLQATGQAPEGFGVLLLQTLAPGEQEVAVVVAGLPPPAAFGRRFTRYVLWLFGGGTLRLGLTLDAAPSGVGTVYAGGIGPMSLGSLSEIAVSAEPPATGSITGPVVLEGSFAFCR